MANYKEIQIFVKKKHGFSVKTCWIADMKDICDLSKGVAPNRISLDSKTNPCPETKKEAILEAFRYFNIIN